MEHVLPFPEAELFLQSFKEVPIEECGSPQYSLFDEWGMMNFVSQQMKDGWHNMACWSAWTSKPTWMYSNRHMTMWLKHFSTPIGYIYSAWSIPDLYWFDRNQVTDLVRDLVVTEVWKDRAFEKTLDAVDEKEIADFNDLKCYMIVLCLSISSKVDDAHVRCSCITSWPFWICSSWWAMTSKSWQA